MRLEIKTTGVTASSPDVVDLRFNFIVERKDYNNVVKDGANIVGKFVDLMNKNFNISKEQMKLSNYNVREINKRVEDKSLPFGSTSTKYVFDHYELNHGLHLEIPFVPETLLKIINFISNLEDGPLYSFYFKLSQEKTKELENESLFKAIDLANEKADKLFEHIRNLNSFGRVKRAEAKIVDAFETNYYARESSIGSANYAMKMCESSIEKQLEKSITPEDIKVKINVINIFEFE